MAIRIILVALAYIASGYLSMRTSGLYGNVLAIFPPAGIALGAWLIWGKKIWPAIAIGALSIVAIVFHQNGNFGFHIVTLVGIITAFGAIFQTWLGTTLISRFVQQPTLLLENRDINLFLLLGGPVSCVVNASIGIGILVFSGNIDRNDALLSWVTWWLADSIGVVIFAPVMLTLFAPRREIWTTRMRGFLYPMLVVISGIAIFFAQSLKWENEKIFHRLTEDSMAVTQSLSSRLEIYLNTLVSIERLFAASSKVDRDEFHLFTAPILEKYDGIQAFEWLPRVTRDARSQYEKSVRDEGYRSFSIKQGNGNNDMEIAGQRDFYFPVTYVEPWEGNDKAFGYDVNSSADRRRALEQAADEARVVATSSVKLVQEKGTQRGVLVIYPQYRDRIVPIDVNRRRDEVIGYVLAVFRINDVLAAALKETGQESMRLTVYDVTSSESDQLLYDDEFAETNSAGFEFESTIDFAGRKWRFEFRPTNAYLKEYFSWIPWTILSIGFVLCGLLGAFLLTISGRNHVVEQLVRQRTLELSAILNGAGDAILTFDENGFIELANPGAEQIFNAGAGKLKNQRINELIALDGGNQNRFSPKVIGDLLRTPREFSRIRENGSLVRFEVSLSKIDLPNRQLFVAIIRDLTERQKIEQLKGEFISIVSHELRTPLTAIKGAISLLRGGVLDPKSREAHQMLETADNNCDRLGLLINDILDVEKLESGKLHFDVKSYKVSDLLENAKQQNEAYAHKFGVDLALETPLANNDIDVDSFRFQQIMSNLISNAVKFSNKGSKVVIAATPRDKSVVITVKDWGDGIPPEFYSSIFNKFAQANPSSTRKRGGTGLGLSITKSLVDAMGGSIRFESVVGRGTTFFCEFPVVA